MAKSVAPAQTEEVIKKQLQATTAIVGGGATGGGILRHLVQEYFDTVQTDPVNTPNLKVDFYEARGQYGFGGPYGVEPPVFRLNQPAGNMSIDRHNPGAFISWFNEWQHNQNLVEVAKARALQTEKLKEGMTESQIALNYPNEYILARRWRENDFLPRTFYGQYLRDEFSKTLKIAENINKQLGREAIIIEQHNAAVSEVSAGPGKAITIKAKEVGGYERELDTTVDAAVIATGHRKNSFLAEYQQHPDYLDTPMTIDMVKEKLAGLVDTRKPIVIAGTSQSMLDALAAIDAVGYKGKIIALSSNAVEPWPFDPAKEAFPDNNYPLKYLTKDVVAKLVDDNPESMAKAAAAYRALLVKELHSPEALAAGPGHVLSTLRYKQEHEGWRESCAGCPGLFERAVSILDEFSGNSTFAERFELFQKYKSEGRLEIRPGRVNGAAASLTHGFDVDVTDTVTNERGTIEASKLINCASMQRVPYYIDPKTKEAHSPDPVIESALQSGLLTIDEAHKTINTANGAVGIVGPAHGGAWGIPYTRDAFESAARVVLATALERVSQAQPAATTKPKSKVKAPAGTTAA